MGRAPCCDKAKVKRGPWAPEEDTALKNYVERHGAAGNWIALPQKAGLKRCGKSCRLRWLNYLRPGIKHGGFTEEEDNIICTLYNKIGSRWSIIASQLPGRTDNGVKNHWNTRLKKRTVAAQPALSTESVLLSPFPTGLVLPKSEATLSTTINTTTPILKHSPSPSPPSPLIIPTAVKTETYTGDDFVPFDKFPAPTFAPVGPDSGFCQDTSFPISVFNEPPGLVGGPSHCSLAPLMEDASTPSSSITVESSSDFVSCWINESGGDQEGLVMDNGLQSLTEYLAFYYGSQEKIGEGASNLATPANTWDVTADTKAQGVLYQCS